MKFKKLFGEKVFNVCKLYKMFPKEEDIELLHQYRVNIRKLQAYLEIYENRFRVKDVGRISKLLKKMLKPTSVVRDLDLFLIEIEKLSIPASTREKMLHIFAFKREKIFEELIQNKRYKKNIKKLKSVLKDDEFKVKELKKEESFEILKAMNETLTQKCEAIEYTTPLYELHTLRKEFKKFRYAYELYKQQFGKDGRLIEAFDLKEIQDTFGVLQDNVTRLKFLKKVRQQLLKSEFEELENYFQTYIDDSKQKLFRVVKAV